MTAGGKTNEHNGELSFGRLLKTLRNRKELDLKTISDETRIAVGTLRLLEAEAYEKLPDEVFVKGFLRAYANMLGTDANRIIQSYLVGRHQYFQSIQFENSLARTGKSFWPHLMLSAGLFACIIVASVAILKNHNDNQEPDVNTSKLEKIEITNTASTDTADIQSPTIQEEVRADQLLQINAVEETWLKIIIDNQDPKQYSLNPGDHLELKATAGFNLLIGNATGVQIRLNNRPIAVDGRHGQVVTLKLP